MFVSVLPSLSFGDSIRHVLYCLTLPYNRTNVLLFIFSVFFCLCFWIISLSKSSSPLIFSSLVYYLLIIHSSKVYISDIVVIISSSIWGLLCIFQVYLTFSNFIFLSIWSTVSIAILTFLSTNFIVPLFDWFQLNWSISLCIILSFVFTCLLIFYWIPDVNFTLLLNNFWLSFC